MLVICIITLNLYFQKGLCTDMYKSFIAKCIAICLIALMIVPLAACEPPLDDSVVNVTETPAAGSETQGTQTQGTETQATETQGTEATVAPTENVTEGTETVDPTPEATTDTPATQAPETETPTTQAPETEEPTPTEDASLPTIGSFSTEDLNGNAYNNSLFSDATLTMVNVWATWCGPCIAELPDIQEISDDFASRGVQIFGIMHDSEDAGMLEEGLNILASSGVSFPSLRNNASVNSAFIERFGVSSLPTTFFVNSQGQVVERVTGSKSYSEWTRIINELLAEM